MPVQRSLSRGAIFAILSLLIILIGGVAVTRSGSSVDASQVANPSFVGTWRFDIVGESAEEGEFLSSSFVTYFSDGTMLASGRSVLPAPPDAPVPVFHLTTGHGVWESTGERTIAGTFVNQRSDSEGNFLGTTTINALAEMSDDGMSITGTSQVVIANPAGETVATRQDLVEAERVVISEPDAATPTG